METKSIEQLEKDIWKNPSEFPTNLVEKCYRYRKISIAELTDEQIRLLISQEIGIKHLIGIALKKLVEQNSELIKTELGEKKFDQINEKTKNTSQII
ncbi:contact-dependent growth inhibition system immunity protein [Croceitalea marina]|uniref:Contact-dependent growth inhibition system immunity protein n=1 Tax=Croceitalea marina TaxID=1775166 RepID=A0ABW5MZV1_9FLAO